MPLTNKTILAIDDADAIRAFLRISMEAQGARFLETSTAQGGLEMVQKAKPDLVVLDLGLPDGDGLDILPDIKAGDSAPRVIILSVRKDPDVKEKARKMGADDYLTKPFMMDDLMDAIMAVIDK